MNTLYLNFDKDNKDAYTYSISESAPSNCEIFDYREFSEIKKTGRYFLFIGWVWSGLDIGQANSLADIAAAYPEI